MTMDYAQWKAACVAAVENLGLAVGDLWDEDDPYDLHDEAEKAFAEKRKPKSFIAEIFEEDLARQAGDEDEFDQSLAYEEGEDFEGDEEE